MRVQAKVYLLKISAVNAMTEITLLSSMAISLHLNIIY